VARRRRDDEELPGVLDVVSRQRSSTVLLRQLPQERLPAMPPTGSREPVEVPARRPRRAITVYECPQCESRYLGEQRCDDCGVFCRRIGFGGTCPHCDEAVAVEDLMGAEAPGA
jgi:hypothetical protein